MKNPLQNFNSLIQASTKKANYVCGLVVMTFALAGTEALAQTSFKSGSWTDPTTWVGGVVPTAATSNVIIAPNHTVSLNSSRTISSLIVQGTLNIDIPSGTLLTNDIAQNFNTTSIGAINVISGNLRVEDDFYLNRLDVTIDGNNSKIIFGGQDPFMRNASANPVEYIKLNNFGKLVVENLGKGGPVKRDDNFLLPIGTITSYTPLFIDNKDFTSNATKTGDFEVTMFDNVYLNAVEGPRVGNAVNKTWDVSLVKGISNAVMTFNWNESDELSGFVPSSNNQIFQYESVTDGWVPVSGVLFTFSNTTSTRTITHTTPFIADAGGYSVGNGGSAVIKPITPQQFPRLAIFDGTGINPLPVELISFTASKKSSEVALTWETASEKNNAGFEVQSSVDGKNYERIGFVASKNANASSVQRYAYSDKTANKEGLVYYRLKQVDLDGSFEYYTAKVVNLGSFTSSVITFPNPFRNQFEVSLQATVAETAQIMVTDMTGKTVYVTQAQLQKGANNLKVTLKDQPAGLYLLKATTNNETYINRLVKQ